jgi:hypothetical protein
MDLANMATPFATTPTRILDLRSEAGRAAIIRRSSASALAADGKLQAGQWIDVAVAFTGPDFSLEAVFANLTAISPLRPGSALLYAPGVRPVSRTVNFTAGQVIANAAFVQTGIVLQHHAVRLHTTRAAWFTIDITGGLAKAGLPTPQAQTPLAKAARVESGRAALVQKVRQAFGRTS